MEIKSFKSIPKKVDYPVCFIVEENDFSSVKKILKDDFSKLESLSKKENFKGKEGEVLKFYPEKSFEKVYIVSLGKKDKIEEESYRKASFSLIKALRKNKEEGAFIFPNNKSIDKAIVEGAILGNYSFDKYKTKEEDKEKAFKLNELFIKDLDEKDLELGKILAEAQLFSRDLVNEPGCVINPLTFAEIAKKECEKAGLEINIYDEKQIQDMGMNGLWMVGKGSDTPPRFIHIVYKPKGKKSKDKIAIVGKGLTFDSGGLNIKTGDYMKTMKLDKSGACNTLAIMLAIAKLKPNIEVHGLMGMAENMPSGKAYRPDDVIRFRNGKTAEVSNTDAEGRLTLADVLSYASELKPSKMIDMATLTGACVVALGEYTAGLFTNNEEFAKELLEIAKKTGERMWMLPMDDENLRKKIESPIADINNTGGRYGGAITAAMFLEEFVDKDIKWVHLDIAGPAYTEKEYSYYTAGGTGFGVRTILEYILSIGK